MPIFYSTVIAIRKGFAVFLPISGFLVVIIMIFHGSQCLFVQSLQPTFRLARRLMASTKGGLSLTDDFVVASRIRSRINFSAIRSGDVVDCARIPRIAAVPLVSNDWLPFVALSRRHASRLYFSASRSSMGGEGDGGLDDSLSSSQFSRMAIPELSTTEFNGDLDSNNFSDADWNQKSGATTTTPIYLQELNPSQIEAVSQPLQQTITRVIAGPGSGKTKVLTCRIAHLLQEDPFGKVLAVTFTRKAAGEMKERLERLLREQEQVLRQLNGGGEVEEEDETIRFDRHGDIVQEFAIGTSNDDVGLDPASLPPKGLERVELGTFHSVCAKIMRYNGELLQGLSSVQRDMSKATFIFVTDPSEPKSDDDDDDESQESGKASPMMVPAEINLDGQFAIVDQAEQLRILKECLDEKEINPKTSDVKPVQILAAISSMKEIFGQNKDPFKDDKDGNKVSMASPSLRLARKVYYTYREKLLTSNAVDFDDLILMTRELLLENEDLRERLHKRWPHVLVDEFQDTSKTQLDLVKLLTSSSLFVVGDADQSIYSWRGAHVGSLDNVKTDFESYGRVHTVQLKENYRSTSNIVRAAEKIISLKHHGAAGDVAEADDARQSMKPQRGAGPSPRVVACEDERGEADFVVETIMNMTATEEITPSNTVAVVYRTNAQSRYLEEACVANNLPYVIRGGAGRFYKRAEIKDCLCFLQWLHNGNDEGSMLRAFKTPSKGIGDKAIAEFRDYCETVNAYYRDFYPLSTRPTILDVLISMTDGDADIEDNMDTMLPFGAPQAIDHISKRAFKNFVAFSAKMRDIRVKAKVKSVDQLIYYVTDELKLMDHFDAISKSATEFNERKENVKELRQAAKKYAAYGNALKDGSQPNAVRGGDFDDESALSNFLDDVALVSDVAEANDRAEGSPARLVVNLMTIHASKGTEFDAVFVVGLEEGTLPCHPAIQQGEGSVQLEEEKRLCYVAMTRAKTQLILTWRRQVTSFSKWSDSGPNTMTRKRSRFLDAIVAKNPKGKASKAGIMKQLIGNSPEKQQSLRSGSTEGHGLKGAESRDRRQLGSVPTRLYRTNTEAVPTPKTGKTGRHRDLYTTDSHELRTSSKTTIMKKEAAAKYSTAPALDIDIDDSTLSSSSLRPMSEDRRKAKRSVNPSVSQPLVDPAWFFPVGEKVVHRNLGKGVVLGHPPFSKIEDAEVTVQFENGRTMEFPALGNDIVPDF